jgi:hypothetical protein
MEWMKSDPEHIFALRQLDKFMANHKGFIAGGCFKNLFNGERMKDVDVFFYNRTDFSVAVDWFNSLDGHDDFEPLYNSPNVTAFRHKASGVTVELVQTIFGTPEEIISQFDFTVTKFAYYKELVKESDPFELEDETDESVWEYKSVYHPQFFEHLHLKRLIIDDRIPFPMSTFNRVLRYRKYGFVPCVETKQKLINELRKLPENEVLVPTSFYEGFD